MEAILRVPSRHAVCSHGVVGAFGIRLPSICSYAEPSICSYAKPYKLDLAVMPHMQSPTNWIWQLCLIVVGAFGILLLSICSYAESYKLHLAVMPHNFTVPAIPTYAYQGSVMPHGARRFLHGVA